MIKNARVQEDLETIQAKQRELKNIWLEKHPKATIFPVYLAEQEYQLKFANNTLIFFDHKVNKLRVIKYKIYLKTETYYDRELQNRDILPETLRKKLSATK